MPRRPAGRFLPILGGALVLAGCGGDDLPTQNQGGPVRIEGQKIRNGDESPLTGTPMNERVAVIGLLNKRNGITTDPTKKPREPLRGGDANVRLPDCAPTAPWENVQEHGTFVQIAGSNTTPHKQ